MMFSKKSLEGEIFIDHRASPGVPEAVALRMGYHPSQVAEGALFEAATYSCPHCQGVIIKNPLRQRERAYCSKCDTDVCDTCGAIMREPGYVHYSVKEIADKVQSGKFTLGGSMGRPILTPIGD